MDPSSVPDLLLPHALHLGMNRQSQTSRDLIGIQENDRVNPAFPGMDVDYLGGPLPRCGGQMGGSPAGRGDADSSAHYGAEDAARIQRREIGKRTPDYHTDSRLCELREAFEARENELKTEFHSSGGFAAAGADPIRSPTNPSVKGVVELPRPTWAEHVTGTATSMERPAASSSSAVAEHATTATAVKSGSFMGMFRRPDQPLIGPLPRRHTLPRELRRKSQQPKLKQTSCASDFRSQTRGTRSINR